MAYEQNLLLQFNRRAMEVSICCYVTTYQKYPHYFLWGTRICFWNIFLNIISIELISISLTMYGTECIIYCFLTNEYSLDKFSEIKKIISNIYEFNTKLMF